MEVEEKKNVGLIDLLEIIFQYKVFIISLTLLSAVISIIVCFVSIKLPAEKSFLPNQYTPRAAVLINNDTSNSNTISSLTNSSIGTIMGLSGFNTGASNSALAVYLISSNLILDKISEEYNIVERYNIKKSPKTNSHKILKDHLKCAYDTDSGVLSIYYTDIDPLFASNVVNSVVNYLSEIFNDINLDEYKRNKENLESNINKTYDELISLENKLEKLSNTSNYNNYFSGSNVVQEVEFLKLEINVQQQIYTQLKTQYEMIKINMESEKPIFQILEYADEPDMKSGPSRGRICILAVFGTFFISIVLCFVFSFTKYIKSDNVNKRR